MRYATVSYPRKRLRCSGTTEAAKTSKNTGKMRARALQHNTNVRNGPMRSGYTLIELMVTVAVIGIATAIAVPSVRQVVRDRNMQYRAVDVVNTYREARARAMLRGRAQNVVLITGTPGQHRVYEGNSNSCMLSWGTGITPWGAGQTPVYTDTRLTWATDVTVQASNGSAQVEICFTPSGRTFVRLNGSSDFAEDEEIRVVDSSRSIAGGIRIFFSNNVDSGLVTRQVFLSSSGQARMAL